jgi:hypothetical protein
MATTDLLEACLELVVGSIAHIDLDTCTLYDLDLDETQIESFIAAVNSCCCKAGKSFELTADLCFTCPTLRSIASAIDAAAPLKPVRSTRIAARSDSSFKAVSLLMLGMLSTSAAQSAGQCNLTEPVRSSYWTTVNHGTYRIVTATSCGGQQYVLYDRGTAAPRCDWPGSNEHIPHVA